MGAFNRLDVPKKRDYPAVQSMLQAAIDNPNIDGIDLHIHVQGLAEFEEQLRYARERLSEAPGKKLLMVSEYSLMWLFKKNFWKGLPGSFG